jgi:hypothetical protein
VAIFPVYPGWDLLNVITGIFLQKKTFLPIMPPETGGGIRRMVMHRSAKIRAASAMGVQYSKTARMIT